MGKLVSLKVWLKTTFCEGSEPCASTVRSWIDAGIIKGGYNGRNTYVVEGELPFENLQGDVDEIVDELINLST